MRYPNCQKTEAFKLFDQGKRPSEIYGLVEVKKHTLFYYYQLWKKEQEEKERERQRIRDQEEEKRRIRLAREDRQRKEALAWQRRSQLEKQYPDLKKRVIQLEWQMSSSMDEQEIIKIGEEYSKAYLRFKEIVRELYPRYADDKSIESILHPAKKAQRP